MTDLSQLSGTTLIVYAVLGLLSLFGVGKIVQMILSRYWSESDRQDEIETTNDGERIRADVSYVEQFLERITKLETKVERLTDEQMSLTKTNVELKSENEHLKETNQRQAKQIDAQAIEITDLRRELGEINRRFNALSERMTVSESHVTESNKAGHQALRLKREWEPKSSVPVVVVEDNADTRELMKVVFEMRNIEVKLFDNGMSALDWLSDNDARVILLDLAMPVMDGLSIAKNIRTNEGLSIGRVPSQIAFYSGQEPDAMVASNRRDFDIKKVFVKGKDDPQAVVNEVICWLS